MDQEIEQGLAEWFFCSVWHWWGHSVVISYGKWIGLGSPRQPSHMSEALWWDGWKSGLNWSAYTWPLQHDGLRVYGVLKVHQHSQRVCSKGPKQKLLCFFWLSLKRHTLLSQSNSYEWVTGPGKEPRDMVHWRIIFGHFIVVMVRKQ